MKIAILADALDTQYAGIHIYVKELLKALYELDKENDYLLIRPSASSEFERWQTHVIPINGKIPFHQRMRQFWHIPNFLNNVRPDIVIEPGHFGPFRLDASIKRVTVIHDLTPILFPDFHIWTSRITHKYLLPSILRNADLIITNSDHTTSDVTAYQPSAKSKTTRTYLGRNNQYKPTPQPSVGPKYGLNSDYILYLGTLEPRKNLEVLIHAYHSYRDANPQAKPLLALAGKKGWKIQSLLDKVNTSQYKEDIHLLGFIDQDDLTGLYSQAICTVYPSLYEGFGFPVLEAMACGVPVISSSSSSLPEVGGDAVLYFDPHDSSTLAKHLSDVTTDQYLRNRMIDQGLTQASKFDWTKTALETKNLLESLVS